MTLGITEKKLDKIVVCQDDVLDSLSTGYIGRAPPTITTENSLPLGKKARMKRMRTLYPILSSCFY